MSHYVIVEINITNPDWVSEYLEKVTPMVALFGGKYLTRTSQVELLEGEGGVPQFSLLAEFPTKEAVMSFYNSEEYRPYKEARQAGSIGRFLLVPSEGVNA